MADEIPPRPVALSCGLCKATLMDAHCDSPSCLWVRCMGCKAVSGHVSVWAGEVGLARKFTEWLPFTFAAPGRGNARA